MENGKIGYEPYWVAYFDLLGFENRIKVECASYPILEDYRTALDEMQTNPTVIGRKWFSDTFLFYTPDDSRTSLEGIRNACESFFYRMIERLIPVRGCLTVGDFHVEDDVLVGPALIEAYRLAECQDWLGFVLSPDAVRRCEAYGIHKDWYREYDVPAKPGKPPRRLEAFILSHRFSRCCSPADWWMHLHNMEHEALDYIEAKRRQAKRRMICGKVHSWREKNGVLRKYRNSKKYLRTLYPQLADFVQGKYGPILLNEPGVRRKVRELSCA